MRRRWKKKNETESKNVIQKIRKQTYIQQINKSIDENDDGVTHTTVNSYTTHYVIIYNIFCIDTKSET